MTVTELTVLFSAALLVGWAFVVIRGVSKDDVTVKDYAVYAVSGIIAVCGLLVSLIFPIARAVTAA